MCMALLHPTLKACNDILFQRSFYLRLSQYQGYQRGEIDVLTAFVVCTDQPCGEAVLMMLGGREIIERYANGLNGR